ncbi:MAG: hypothetical protein ACI9R3_003782 [Verrucomicrobiales bacterium]|jgi:hypothetical protein
MSHHPISVSDLPVGGEKLETSRLSAVMTGLFGVGVVGLVLSVIFFFQNPEGFAFSWLFAFFFAFTLCVGSLFWVLLHNASNSGWGVAIRRVPEVLANLFPFLMILGLPLVLPFGPFVDGQNAIWEWIEIHRGVQEGLGGVGADAHRAALHDVNLLLYEKYPFLNLFWSSEPPFLPGWIPRYFIYFGLLTLGARVLLGYSTHQDATGDVQTTFSARRFSCGWLPVFAICMTFGAVDWIMSMTYSWFSTMWGVYIFAGSAMSSMALIILCISSFKKLGYLKIVNEEHYHIMGKLMHSFVIFWAYITFSQYFMIWYANITEETQFYLIRNTGGWQYLSVLLVLVHFLIPFVVLLIRSVKKSVLKIGIVSGWLLGAHMLDLYWIIIPMRGPRLYSMGKIAEGENPLVQSHAWMGDVVALVTVVSILAYIFLRFISRVSLYPCGDPRLDESIKLTN